MYRPRFQFPHVGVFLHCPALPGRRSSRRADSVRAEIGPDAAIERGPPTTGVDRHRRHSGGLATARRPCDQTAYCMDASCRRCLMKFFASLAVGPEAEGLHPRNERGIFRPRIGVGSDHLIGGTRPISARSRWQWQRQHNAMVPGCFAFVDIRLRRFPHDRASAPLWTSRGKRLALPSFSPQGGACPQASQRRRNRKD